jgi:flagellar hook assembly protein FlgD
MSREGRVRVSVYSMQGRLVKTLLDEYRSAGAQKLAWDGSSAQNQKVASGVYFFRIQTPEGEINQKIAVVK